jgi:diguanylate cyclase (GGDEF)-like protein
MELDVRTMFAVTITVAAVLGLLLLYTWYQQRKVTALVWWGGAHFVACVGVWLIGSRETLPPFWSIEIANALLFVSAGMIWMGARRFDGAPVSVIGVFGGAIAWMLAAQLTDFMLVPHGPVIFSSMIIAAYTFASATEIWKGREENLVSRVPLTVMLAMHGALYLLRVPFAILMPGPSNETFFSTAWFGVIGLESLLYMIATAFVFLAMSKERVELEHKRAATTDPLTGIPNRRAFLETAVRSLKQRNRAPQPVSALLFDLDRFKSINDRYGHAVGDRVLRTFADIAVIELRSTDILGRLGGEEFGAVLFGAEAASAASTAERIRAAFAASFTTNGAAGDEISVSVGVASVPAEQAIDLETLMSKADEALYVAKARGRNRVEIADGYSVQFAGLSGREVADEPVRRAGQAAAFTLGPVVSPSVVPKPGSFQELEEARAIAQHRA